MLAKLTSKHTRFVKHALFVFLTTLLIFILCFFAYFFKKDSEYTSRIYPNIYLDNVNIGGKTADAAEEIINQKEVSIANTELTILFKREIIATFSANTLGVKRNTPATIAQAYSVGREKSPKKRLYNKFVTLFNLKKINFATQIDYNQKPLINFIAQSKKTYNSDPQNALFEFDNGRVKSFKQEKKGYRIDEESFLKESDKAINSLSKKQIVLRGQEIEPDITLSEANNLGIEELIGEGKSDFAGSHPERIHNITVAASRFNGVLIPANSVLSFDQTVGDITTTTGFVQAYVIQNGKTVLGDGGGVCQVSTTLFRAALNTGLPILERTAHAYRVGYYENDSKPGLDATIFYPTVDLKIKNDTPTHILIQTEIIPGTTQLYFRLYGKKDGRQVYLSQPTLYDQQPPPPTKYQDDPTLKRGQTKQVDFAAWGGKTNFEYKVTKSNGQISFEKNFYSNFRPWQAVYLVGTAD